MIEVRTLSKKSTAMGWSNGRTVAIDRPKEKGGMGIGFNGGELLFLSVGACVTNDLFREADKLNLQLDSVQITVKGDWGGDPLRAKNIEYTVSIDSKEDEDKIMQLIKLTDKVAEIPNTLRFGSEVKLGNIAIND